jgi:alginate O-acetyltransferase complex protein AlgI
MAFNSITFLVFFLIVLAIHNLPLSWRAKKLNLLLASYIFYSAWNPAFVVLIWISTATDYVAAGRMGKAKTLSGRRLWLVVSLAINLGLLGFFKYRGFFLDNFIELAGLLNIEFQPAESKLILPVGISFYTFQTLSYSIDVFRGKMKPWKSLLDFAMFVTFFPQLVAGPIVRANEFLPQCEEPRRANTSQLGWGLALLTIGVFQKDIFADLLLAPVSDKVYAAAAQTGFASAWTGALAFSNQVFFDFAGYSTCAIGAGLCLGFTIPANFRSPYAAIGIRDFWRRWHISLSTWLRDYLYISMGGNRKGPTRTYIFMFVTMLLGGLWHGAAWRFVAWGGLHGVFLGVERILRKYFGDAAFLKKLPVRLLLALFTYLLHSFALVVFRSPDFTSAFHMISSMFAGGRDRLALSIIESSSVLGVSVFVFTSHWILRDSSLEEFARKIPWWALALALGVMLIAIIFQPGDNRAFFYFQF